ncbi:hypothetical protein AMATHDRAFT_137999 [Amanita thiersii Skay4041]|uniref:Uncharacterized protein n=1 Tax=Amanita thiersii Skay4041 TaxID=703135 RepID=A0A2A9NTF0_9AGAR|nr:hypothetical protein AMATHDRAFT_137999 [Amanita thiersii Skay4041]
MGKSAKYHKRIPKKLKFTDHPPHPTTTSTTPLTSSSPKKVQNAKKRTDLKAKASKFKSSNLDGGLLGGADYVALLMGGRRKAQEEAQKLPHDEEHS